MLQIIHVRTEADAEAVRLLVGEYIGWITQRYPDQSDLLDTYFRVQDMEGQMR